MNTRREGLVWQVGGFAVVIAAAWLMHSAMQEVTRTLNGRSAGLMDVLWPCLWGVFAGFLVLAGANAMISGHVMRVTSGGRHRGWIWKLAGVSCCLAGLIAIVDAKMADVYISSARRIASSFDSMVTDGGFAIAMSGGYVSFLGIMLLSADRVCTNIRRRADSGLPVPTEAASVVKTGVPSRGRPIVLAGLPMGVLGGLQIAIGLRAVGLLWGIASGLLACYLFRRINRHAIKLTDGTRCGMLAGLICGVVTAGVWLLTALVLLFLGRSGVVLPPLSIEALGIVVAGLLAASLLGAMSGGIGGVLGALILRKRIAPGVE